MIKENDVCILYVNGLPGNFVRIESIEPDVKPGWYEVNFIELTFPLQTIKWKIDEDHLKGGNINMKGTTFNLQLVPNQVNKKTIKEKKQDELIGSAKTLSKVINMADFKERRKIKEPPEDLPPDVA